MEGWGHFLPSWDPRAPSMALDALGYTRVLLDVRWQEQALSRAVAGFVLINGVVVLPGVPFPSTVACCSSDTVASVHVPPLRSGCRHACQPPMSLPISRPLSGKTRPFPSCCSDVPSAPITGPAQAVVLHLVCLPAGL